MGLNFQNVNFKYNPKANKFTLKDINLSIASTDEFITILGHTGSGKSTLTQLANALLLPNSGEIEVFDKTIYPKNNENLKYVRSKVGVVFQFPEYQLFDETVLKDVSFGPKNFGKTKEEALEIAKESLKLVGIDESLFDRSPFNLSGGQMRRIAIAGILASDPQILILDEPTVGLDPKGRNELMDLLKDIQEKTHKTIIIVTHNMDVVARLANRCLVLNEGEIVKDTTPRELFGDIEFLNKNHLDMPEATRLAIELKNSGLIDYQELPITKEELENAIIAHFSTNFDKIEGDNNEH